MSPSPPSSSSWSPEKVCAAAVVSLSLAHLVIEAFFNSRSFVVKIEITSRIIGIGKKLGSELDL